MPVSRMYKEFKEKFQGKLILPDNHQYEEARKVWNDLYDKYPAAIAKCKNSSEVQDAITFARENKVELAVRGGGHDYAGNSVCDEGLVIDLSKMNKVEVDPDAKTADVQGGATIGQLDEATQKYSLAIPTGTVSSIGIGGLTLGGGSGYLSRKFGLTLDSLISAEIVTADGKIVIASESENEDLFWAIRGGGGNFGIVTSFKFRLHEVGPEVLFFQAYFPFKESSKILKFYREFMEDAPEELQCYAFFLNVPPVDPFPKEFHGKTTCALVACYAGDPQKGKAVLQPLVEIGDPIFNFQQNMKYPDIQKSFDAGMPKGLRWFTKAHYLPELNNSVISTILDFTASLSGAYTLAYLEPASGAITRIPSTATAFPHRKKSYSFHIFPGWQNEEDDEKNIEWAKDFYRAIKNESNGGVYVNLMSHDEKDRIRNAYGENFERLVEVKKKWDPNNLFRSNHNIKPATEDLSR
ncbi:MAG: FAD-binding oxidoreductase [Gillisia sp.]